MWMRCLCWRIRLPDMEAATLAVNAVLGVAMVLIAAAGVGILVMTPGWSRGAGIVLVSLGVAAIAERCVPCALGVLEVSACWLMAVGFLDRAERMTVGPDLVRRYWDRDPAEESVMNATIAENMKLHPEWFVDPTTVTAGVQRFLDWQAKQPNPVGPGTIGDAWAQGGTGMYYHTHVAAAQEALAQHAAWNAQRMAGGHVAEAAPWELPEAAPAPTAEPVPGMVIGGTATATANGG